MVKFGIWYIIKLINMNILQNSDIHNLPLQLFSLSKMKLKSIFGYYSRSDKEFYCRYDGKTPTSQYALILKLSNLFQLLTSSR